LLRTRVQTGLVLAAIVATSIFLLETRWAALVFGVFWFIGALEWSRLAQLARTPRRIFAGAIGVFFLGVIAFGLSSVVLQAGLWLALAGWAVIFLLIRHFPQPMPIWPIIVAGLVVLPGAWLAFYALHAVRPGLVLAGLVIVWAADTGAYFVGRGIGRTPLAPRVSPKKTWEGVVGGVVAAAIVGGATAAVLELPLPLLGLLAAVSGLL
jgi:phosphatidate cytidylyltransferase